MGVTLLPWPQVHPQTWGVVGTPAWDRNGLQSMGSVCGVYRGRCGRETSQVCSGHSLGVGGLAVVDARELYNALGLAADSPCDLGLVSSSVCASTIPSLQWEWGGAELWNPPGPSHPGPAECRPPDLPGRTDLLFSGPPAELGGGSLLSLSLGWERCSFW